MAKDDPLHRPRPDPKKRRVEAVVSIGADKPPKPRPWWKDKDRRWLVTIGIALVALLVTCLSDSVVG